MHFDGEIILTLETDILLNNILLDKIHVKVDVHIY